MVLDKSLVLYAESLETNNRKMLCSVSINKELPFHLGSMIYIQIMNEMCLRSIPSDSVHQFKDEKAV